MIVALALCGWEELIYQGGAPMNGFEFPTHPGFEQYEKLGWLRQHGIKLIDFLHPIWRKLI